MDNIEYQSKVDNAWYTSCIAVLDDTLLVKLPDFPDTMDEKFAVSDLATIAEVDAVVARFRSLSSQLQDDECYRVKKGMRVCTLYQSMIGDVQYFDAIIFSVNHKEHLSGKEEECKCEFLLTWLHGPLEGTMTNTTGVVNICMIEPFEEIDSRLESFSKMAKKKIEHSPMSGSGCCDKVCLLGNRTTPPSTKRTSCSSQHSIQVKQEKKQFPIPLGRKEEAEKTNKHQEFQDTDFTMAGRISKCPEINFQDIDGSFSVGNDILSSPLGATTKYSTLSQGGVRVKEENGQFLGSFGGKEDFGGILRTKINPPSLAVETSKMCSTGNVQQAKKDNRVGSQFLSQAGIAEGLSRSEEPESHHFILVDNVEKDLSSSSIVKFIQNHTSTSPQACVFPSLSSELYTRGVIEIDSEKKLKQICKFLNNPDHIVTSSKGRPWVIHEEPSRCKTLKTTIGGVTSIPQEKNTVEELKVVHRRAQEYRGAKRMRDLFLEFAEHQKGLHKKLALEEKKISQLLGSTSDVSRSSYTK